MRPGCAAVPLVRLRCDGYDERTIVCENLDDLIQTYIIIIIKATASELAEMSYLGSNLW